MSQRMRVLHMQSNLQEVKGLLDKISYQGFTHVKVGPLQPCFRFKGNRNEWYWDYQPLYFNIGNHYGNEYDLCELTLEAHKRGIQIITDVVIRHVAGQPNNPLYPSEEANREMTSKRDYWMAPIEHSEHVPDWRYQMAYRCYGLPCINYNNQEVLDRFIFPFLDDVLTYSDGIRIDMGQHFALPSEGSSFWYQIAKRYSHKLIIAECCYLNAEYVRKYSDYCLPHVENYTITGHYEGLHSYETHDTYLNFGGRTSNDDTKNILNEYAALCNRYAKTEFYARPGKEDWKDVSVKVANMKWEWEGMK